MSEAGGNPEGFRPIPDICLGMSGSVGQFSPSPPFQSNVGFLIRNRPSRQPTRAAVLNRSRAFGFKLRHYPMG